MGMSWEIFDFITYKFLFESNNNLPKPEMPMAWESFVTGVTEFYLNQIIICQSWNAHAMGNFDFITYKLLFESNKMIYHLGDYECDSEYLDVAYRLCELSAPKNRWIFRFASPGKTKLLEMQLVEW